MQSVVNWFRSWRLLSWRTAVVVAVVIYALVGFFAVPVFVKKLIVETARERTGREVTVEEVRCNPFALSLTIRGFSFPDRPGSTMLAFDEFYANAQVSSLFRWAATLKEFRIDNPYLGVRRFADGGINVLELMDDIEARTPPDEEPDDEGGLPRALLQHILVTGSSIDIEDRARVEPLTWKLGPSRFELHDISTIPEHHGDHDFVIGMERGGRIGVTGDVVVEPLGLEGSVEIDKIYLDHTWEALQPFFEFKVVNGVAGGRFSYKVFIDDDGPHALIHDANYLVEGIEITAGTNDETVLKVGSITTSDVSIAYPEAQVRGSSIVVEDAEAFQWIRPDGTPSWNELVPEETQDQVVKTYKQVEEAFPWDIALDRFEIKNATARVEDRTFPEPLDLVVEEANLVLTDVATGGGRQWGLVASAKPMGDGMAKLEGSVVMVPIRIEVEVSVEDLNVGHIQPYLERIAPLDLRAGVLETKGTVIVEPNGDGPVAGFVGDLTINRIDLRETAVGSRVLQWGRVETRGIDAAVGPLGLDVASIDIYGAGIDIVVSEDGRVNLIELFNALAERSASAGGGGTGGMPPVAVKAVTLHGCSGAYTDRTLTPPFTLALDPVDGTIRGISSKSRSGAQLEIEAPVRSGGLMDLEGEMDLFDPKRLTDLSIDLRQTALPPISPMSVRYIGHPIDEGTVDISLRYEIKNSDLVGSNRFVTDRLALGDKVEGEGMVNLPFKLGVSLLTDKEGHITLEFPIEGNLDDPAFGLGNAIGSAAKEIVGELVKSPFRLLAKLGGGSGDEDLGDVEFKAGSAELGNPAVEKLRTLAAGAEQRPELVLQVAGAYDEEADTAALQEAALEALIAERQSGDEAAAEGTASLELLEEVYRESGGLEDLETLRARNTTPGEGAEPELDQIAYSRDLKAALAAAQPVGEVQLRELGSARAAAIRAFFVDEAGIDPSRVEVLQPVPVEPSGERWVRCALDVAAGGGE